MPSTLTAPFPWFGGKRRAAPLVWPRLGRVDNYVEPFAGSLAVLLQNPHVLKTETVNDRDAYVSNFWRALAADPEPVLAFADWPVSEADLHARHVWLLEQIDFRERMLTEPHFFDARIAGYWWYGVSSWIGSSWCDYDRFKSSSEERQTDRQTEQESIHVADPQDTRARIQSRRPRRSVPRQLPVLSHAAKQPRQRDRRCL